jgi:hypothetical protein
MARQRKNKHARESKTIPLSYKWLKSIHEGRALMTQSPSKDHTSKYHLHMNLEVNFPTHEFEEHIQTMAMFKRVYPLLGQRQYQKNGRGTCGGVGEKSGLHKRKKLAFIGPLTYQEWGLPAGRPWLPLTLP